MRITVFLILVFSAGTVLQASDSLTTRVGEDTMISRHPLDNNCSEMLFPVGLRHAMRTGWGPRATFIAHLCVLILRLSRPARRSLAYRFGHA